MPPRRIESHPLTSLDRGKPVTIHHNGKPLEGNSQEPLAVALYAANRRVLSRSMRYHRARGYFCGTGECTHCFVNLNGTPNARSCLSTCQAHDWMEDQNAFPNVEQDMFAAADVAFPKYLDAHRAFIRPAFLKPLYTRILRGMAGFGRVPNVPIQQRFHHENVTTDILVVGAGPAGLAAAEGAARDGAKVLLIDRQPKVGGRLRHLPTPFLATGRDAPKAEGKSLADDARVRLEHAGVTIRTDTRLVGIYPGPRLVATTPTRLLEINAKHVVLATGARDAYLPIPGADRAGVLLATAALKLLNQHGVLPGERVAIVGAERHGLLLARDLLSCGAKVAGIVDPQPDPEQAPLVDHVRRLGVSVRWGTRPAAIEGRKQPRALRLDSGDRWPCDAVVLASGRAPAVELAQQAGCRLGHSIRRGGFHVTVDAERRTTVSTMWAAGSVTAVRDEWASHLAGRVAGLSAANSLSPLHRLKDALADAMARRDEYRVQRGLAPLEVRS